MSEKDAACFSTWLYELANTCHDAYCQYRVGRLDKERRKEHRDEVRAIFEAPGIVRW